LKAARGTAGNAMGAAPPGALRGVQVLLPVWGPSYLRQCMDVLLPSLLAAGNLPAVAAAIPAVLILSTQERNISTVSRHPAWRALAAICDARLESLDTLLSEAHSVVLTLVYARAIRAAGDAARDIGFVLLVADYVLADGALRAVLGRLQGGAAAVLAGNFQISGQAVAAPAPGRALAISPRALVRLGLQALHPASRACMPGGTAHDARANRVFWPVGSDALAGRFYLLHPIGLRPETLDVCIAAPCDYSFVPEFCPAGRIETITDSDEYMVAEMQGAGAADLLPGPLGPAGLAASLAAWVTARHRRNAVPTICYHAAGLGEIEDELAGALAASARFIAETERRLGAVAHPHRHHPIWRGLLAHHQATALHPVDDAGLAAILGAGGVPGGLGRFRKLLLGRMPRPRPWHPRWADWRVLRGCLASHAAGRRVLIACAESGRLSGELVQGALAAGAVTAAQMPPEAILAAPADPAGPRFDFVLAIIRPLTRRPASADGLAGLCAAIANLLTDDGLVLLALSDLSDAPACPLALAEIAETVLQAAPALLVARIQTVPAPGWRLAAQAGMMRHARAATQAPKAARLWHFAAGMANAAASLVANLACLRQAPHRLDACSTVLIHLRRAARPAMLASNIAIRQASPWTA